MYVHVQSSLFSLIRKMLKYGPLCFAHNMFYSCVHCRIASCSNDSTIRVWDRDKGGGTCTYVCRVIIIDYTCTQCSSKLYMYDSAWFRYATTMSHVDVQCILFWQSISMDGFILYVETSFLKNRQDLYN